MSAPLPIRKNLTFFYLPRVPEIRKKGGRTSTTRAPRAGIRIKAPASGRGLPLFLPPRSGWKSVGGIFEMLAQRAFFYTFAKNQRNILQYERFFLARLSGASAFPDIFPRYFYGGIFADVFALVLFLKFFFKELCRRQNDGLIYRGGRGVSHRPPRNTTNCGLARDEKPRAQKKAHKKTASGTPPSIAAAQSSFFIFR